VIQQVVADLRDRKDKDQIVEQFGIADPIVVNPKHPSRHTHPLFPTAQS
jgi:hypothetical protein